ncbi:MAG: hypothetical protein KA214_07155, partial [Neisseriaceae bacterium]|nr:hypothetical protein [Neisseriaceae bacterium]
MHVDTRLFRTAGHALFSLICLFGCVFFTIRSADILGFAGILGLATLCWLLLLSARRPLFWGLAFPLLLGAVLYLPTALMYGFPTEDIVLALFYSNPGEAAGYLSVLGNKEYAYAGALLACAIGFGLSYQRYGNRLKSRTALLAALVLALLFSVTSSRQAILDKTYPFAFVQAFTKIYQAFAAHDFAPTGLSDWQISASAPRYQDYVLIIGESARKDYLSAFGYPQDTS